jgi:hypothetical protein
MFNIKRQKNGIIRYICNVCRILYNDEGMVDRHIKSKRHNDNMKRAGIDGSEVENFFKAKEEAFENSDSPQSSSEFEKEIESSRLNIGNILHDRKEIPLMGAEYMVYFSDVTFCFLCDFINNDNMENHITTIRHRTKYLSTHFPSMAAIIDGILDRAKQRRDRTFSTNSMKAFLLQHAAMIICRRFGCMPMLFESKPFTSQNPREIRDWIQKKGHFNERDDPSIVKAFNEKDIEKIMREGIEKLFSTKLPNSSSTNRIPTEKDLTRLGEKDLKILLQHFDDLPASDQQQLSNFIKASGPSKTNGLWKILDDKGAFQLKKILRERF